ncbi:MAG: MotA/TolQ/ExbB proton channel family protein, partial [Candidatus Brocadiae bacterium]|nr:MotA/TolQ/ExbB proton channel family protein [Candidatus Brocadiia bacterium]
LAQVLGITSVVKKTLFCKLSMENDLIQKMVNYSAINRRDGALALEQHLKEAGDEFLVTGLQMVIDGQTEEAVERQLAMEIEYLQARHEDGKKILEFMGASAPAWGMIGTLIGLVQMLRQLEDPSKIGVGMATALLTTFYGALLANLLFIPLSGKLQTRGKEEDTVRQMMIEGLQGIQAGVNPSVLEDRLTSFLAPGKRVGAK